MNRYWNPVKTIEGAGVFHRLPDVLTEMGLVSGKLLILAWSDQVWSHPVFEALSSFETKKMVLTLSNPTVSQLFQCYQETKAFSPDVVVAIGGGSILDVGKSLCYLYGKEFAHEDALREWIQKKDTSRPAVQWIGVPTTAGTGSEVTCWATIWDPEQNAKRSMENHSNYAYAALVDPELTKGMPAKLAVSSALDAVAHAVESYWAKATNPVSRALALEAVRTIMGQMEDLLAGKETAPEAMAQGSMLAGLAFSNTKTTACHSISYPLTMHYGIPHGAAVSMLLAPVMEMNAVCVPEMDALLNALGTDSPQMLGQQIRLWLQRSGQPATLEGWGVPKQELPRLAALGMTKGRADNNPVELTAESIQQILESIY